MFFVYLIVSITYYVNVIQWYSYFSVKNGKLLGKGLNLSFFAYFSY